MKNKGSIIAIVISIIIIVSASYISLSLNVLNPINGAYRSIDGVNFTSGTVNMQGLDFPVNVTIDTSGMSHISAKNNHDLFFAQGYYSASQRLFQMEMQSALAAGNLSKIIGKAGISSDYTMRLIGLNTNAYRLESDLRNNYSTYYSYLKDYANGVNAFINQTSNVKTILGFSLIGVSPYKWTVYDSLVWQEYMAWSLATGSASVLQSDLFYNALGYSNYSQIFPYYPYYTANVTMIPGSGTVNGYNLTDRGISPSYFWNLDFFQQWSTGINTTLIGSLNGLISMAYKNITDPYILPGSHVLGSPVGSNSWIITSNYSSANSPMMANDPHLPLLSPSLWIPFQLTDPYFNITGWGLAGLPGILIGHTSTTSFGLTTPEGNSANDYLEILNGNSYLYNGVFHKLNETNFTLNHKQYTIYSTNNGPLIARNGSYGISMNWNAQTPSLASIAEIMLDQAKNYSQMMNALSYWGPSPEQNFALVSEHHAGYITAGGYPLIKETLPNGKNLTVIGSISLLNGSIPKYEEIGNVPFKYLPQKVNPSRGYMFAPNQPTVGKNYPYPFVGSYWASGGRAETISNYLAAHHKVTLADMEALQSNVTDYWASQFNPLLVNAIAGMGNLNYSERFALNLLENWNYSYYQNMKNPTVYLYLTAAFYNITYNKIYLKEGINGLVPSPYTNTAIYMAKNDPSSVWFNGSFSAEAKIAFAAAVAFMDSKIGNVSNWNWGNAHKLEIESLTGLSQLSIGPIPIWGGRHTVSVGYTPRILQYPLPYVTVGSSLRTIDDPGKGIFLGVFPGGPSENILSYWFANQLPYWLNHDYYNMYGLQAEVRITYAP
ncbi:MAG: penicillin acylase family protein [Thermoplasmataceae archaeon]